MGGLKFRKTSDRLEQFGAFAIGSFNIERAALLYSLIRPMIPIPRRFRGNPYGKSWAIAA
jgi:hypothetical protein